ncbi:hypothetical protein M0R45_009588 [Rubus argutus]|uniref:Cytochrome P450 n=1 Tax=Rubus argutus TaxID=59490 RepID=A0AAW1Y4E2_RUBAR
MALFILIILGLAYCWRSFSFISEFSSPSGIYSFMNKRQQRYGKVFKTFVLGRFSVFMTGREASKMLLAGKDGMVSLNLFYTGQQVLGPTSLLQTTGEEHKRLRRLIAEPLSVDGLKKYFQFINNLAIETLGDWPRRTVLVLEEAFTFTLKVIGNMIMSLDPACEEQEKFRANFKLISSSFASLPFKLPAIDFHSGIQARDRMTNNVLTLLVASHDTTTAALTSLIKFLGLNPAVLEQLRDEHRQIQGNRNGVNLTWSEVNNALHRQAQVINETLRRATISPWFSRKAAQNFEIDGYKIERFDEPPKPFSFLGFGSGQCICPGINLAKLKILVFIYHLYPIVAETL